MNGTESGYFVGQQDQRPWGSWETTAVVRDGAVVTRCEKSIVVKPGQRLSVQSHTGRHEVWAVEEGVAHVYLGTDPKNLELTVLNPGQSIEIPIGTIHRLENRGSEALVIHEIQTGVCDEADIQRYSDDYGRAPSSL